MRIPQEIRAEVRKDLRDAGASATQLHIRPVATFGTHEHDAMFPFENVRVSMPTIAHGKADLKTDGRKHYVTFPPPSPNQKQLFRGAPTVVASAETYYFDENPAMDYNINEALITIGKVDAKGFWYQCKFTPAQFGGAGWHEHHLLNWVAMEGA